MTGDHMTAKPTSVPWKRDIAIYFISIESRDNPIESMRLIRMDRIRSNLGSPPPEGIDFRKRNICIESSFEFSEI